MEIKLGHFAVLNLQNTNQFYWIRDDLIYVSFLYYWIGLNDKYIKLSVI